MLEEFSPEEQRRIDNGLCFRCGHELADHDESECRGGEEIRCLCDCYEDPNAIA